MSATIIAPAFVGLMRECSNDELNALMHAVADELLVRALNMEQPMTRAADRLRRTRPFAEKQRLALRVVGADERPARMQWNEARQQWL